MKISMTSLRYKEHFITYGAIPDRFTGEYTATGQISWQSAADKHQKHSFTLSKLFSNADDASAAAVEEAIVWTDQRLARVRP